VAASFPALGGDVHASSEYRADLIPIIARRALAALLAA
jgi:CO/xanthine dehydrogenase FAD-binding subunit